MIAHLFDGMPRRTLILLAVLLLLGAHGATLCR